jgi:hypothetical protein
MRRPGEDFSVPQRWETEIRSISATGLFQDSLLGWKGGRRFGEIEQDEMTCLFAR